MPLSITFKSLDELLDILWGSRDYCFPPRHIADQISAIDSTGSLCHVQVVDYDNKPLEQVKIWRKGLWEVDYQRWKTQKNTSDRELAEWNLIKGMVEYIIGEIDKKSPGSIPRELLETIAKKFYLSKNEIALKQFGVDIEKITWTDSKLNPL